MRVLVAGGGSGGHVYPGLAVLEELRDMEAIEGAGWVGTPAGIEAEILKGYPWITFFPLPCRGLDRRRPWTWPAFFAATVASLPRALAILRSFRPTVVLGMGGYPSFAPVLAAAVLGIPRAIHEQNAALGLANRVLIPFVSRIFLSFAGTAGVPRWAKKVEVTGLPVRRGFRDQAREVGTHELLVFGGSQGSRPLVEATLRAAPALARLPGLRLRLLVGRAADPAEVEARLKEAGLFRVQVERYTDRMPEALARARLVLARAGASTVAELAATGRPAILVSWQAAAGGHQVANARALAAAGGCVLLEERDLLKADLGELVANLWRDETRLRRMATAAQRAARPDAARKLAEGLLALGKGRG